MTPAEKADAIVELLIAEFGKDVDISKMAAPGYKLRALITDEIGRSTPDLWQYNSHVNDEQFQEALQKLTRAIQVKDTPEEWAKFTGRTLLFVGKLAIAQFGFGPAVSLVEQLFGPDHELVGLVKLLGEKLDEDNE